MSAEIIRLRKPIKKSRRRCCRRERSAKSLAFFQAYGARLRAARLTLEISEAEAAAASLITLRTYRRREAGLPFHGWHEGLHSLVVGYDLSYDWLYMGKGPMRLSECEAREQRLYGGRSNPKPKLTLVNSIDTR
jgi:hypothetical protein